MTLTIYGSPPTRLMRVLWVLNELDIPHRRVPVDMDAGEHRSPAFLAVNPAGKVPALVDGDLVISESAAIMLYLAERHGAGRLIPADLADRARMYHWHLFLVAEIEGPLWRMALHSFIYPEADRDPAEVGRARREAAAMLDVLDRHLAGRSWLVGDRMTVADLNAAYMLDWADTQGLLEGRPALASFLERMYARPGAPMRIEAAFAAAAQGASP